METVSTPEFRPFFEHLKAGRLAFPYCEDCGRYHWYPMPRCPHCRGVEIAWRAVEGPAEVYTWTVVRHAFDPALADELPYVVALVVFAEAPGVRLLTNLVEVEPADIAIAMAVAPIFPEPSEPSPRVTFRPLA
jgi:uncharacterized OB-fold protein